MLVTHQDQRWSLERHGIRQLKSIEAYDLRRFAYWADNVICQFVLEWGMKRSEISDQLKAGKKSKKKWYFYIFDTIMLLEICVLSEDEKFSKKII